MNSLGQFLKHDVNPQPSLIWRGTSGTTYELYQYAIGSVFYEVPGVYVFCKLVGTAWYAVYVGESDNLYRRLTQELTSHHQLKSALAAGATHISARRIDGGATERLRVETDLRHGLNPPCNRQ